VALAGVTAFTVAAETSSLLAIPVGLLTGAAAGLVAGLVVTRVRVNSFIVTLGMLSVARGLALLVTGGLPVDGPPALQALGQGALGPVPVQVIILLVIAVVGQLVLTRTVFGNQVQAVGDNPEAARLSGIPVARIKVACLVLVGLLAGLAGLIRGAQLGVAEPNAAVGLELSVIAAVIIGGTSLSGGRGSVTGALLGAVLLGLIQNAFVLLHLSNFLQVLSTGLIISRPPSTGCGCGGRGTDRDRRNSRTSEPCRTRQTDLTAGRLRGAARGTRGYAPASISAP
jgi:ribose/xylose/arabinose/galactoside ABC-type transport system permease subunit